MTINFAFFRAADIMHDASPMIKELLEDGVRVLNLAGDADFACNYIVSKRYRFLCALY
jgi:carboxypeptidase C (cathepsin A)